MLNVIISREAENILFFDGIITIGFSPIWSEWESKMQKMFDNKEAFPTLSVRIYSKRTATILLL